MFKALNSSKNSRKHFILLTALLSLLLYSCATKPPLEQLNTTLHKNWDRAQLSPVPKADDATFLRRITIDLTGRAPTLKQIQDFTQSNAPDKRQKLIQELLNSEAYADMMAMRYGDIFRVKSEFPINLWPNAVQAYHRYLRDIARNDVNFQQFAQEMLTASGSNFRVAPANFFRATADHTPGGLARVTCLSWLGIRLENLPPKATQDMSPIFTRIAMKSTAEWKEQIVYTDTKPGVLKVRFPDGESVKITLPQEDPREVLAQWVIHSPQFARAWANRAWFWMTGYSLDNAQPDNMTPPKSWTGKRVPSTPNEKLLECLAEEFARSNYSMKHLLELIALSEAYQASWQTTPEQQAKATELFAVYPIRRHDAEVIVDMLADITGRYETYRSVIPEPFTILPAGTRAVQINDGSISSSTLDTFGRPPRDSGLASERNNAITDSQRLFLMNSTSLHNATLQMVRRKLTRQYKKLPQLTEACYLMVLSRKPTQEEMKKVQDYFNALPVKSPRLQTAGQDLIWCLINSREFLYHH